MVSPSRDNPSALTAAKRALLESRRAARERAAKALAARPHEADAQPSREPPRPLTAEEESVLVAFYAQKLPGLCDLCGAPADVRWTALVFYRRLFASRSPIEFDPLPMMFACVHLACEIEEVHEITLDRLLDAADFGADASLRAKVASLELPLLEGISFRLLIEPKPASAIQVLSEELQRVLAGSGAAAAAQVAWPEAASAAERLVMDLGIRSDAVLLWPTSVVVVAAFTVALKSSRGYTPALSATLESLWDAHLGADSHRENLRGMVAAAIGEMEKLPNMELISEESVKESAKQARRCHRAFERLREEASQRQEANRKERKRQWSEMKGANTLSQLKSAPLGSPRSLDRHGAPPRSDPDDFVIRRPREDDAACTPP